MIYRVIALAVIVWGGLLSQPRPPLWSKDSAVVVGDLMSGASHEENARAFVTGALRVCRTLQGVLQPGTMLALVWDYSALGVQPLSETSTVTPGRGLWVLDRVGPVWRPRRLTNAFPGTMGGVVLPVPLGDIVPEYAYPPEASAEAKFAWELAASLAAEAREKGDELNSRRTPDGYTYGSTTEQTWFADRADVLNRFPPASTRSVYQALAASPLPNLQMIGIAGLLRQNEPAALLALERNFAALARTRCALGVAYTLRPELLRADPTALATLGRLALSETIFPDLEQYTARLLSSSHRVEALPYLMAMLGSPRFEQRWNTVRGLCELLPSVGEGSGPLGALWEGETMGSKCLRGQPPPDDQQAEEVYAFWRNWWASTRPRLERAGGLMAVASPERYRNGPSSHPVERAAITRAQWFVECARSYGSWLRQPPEQQRTHSALLLNPRLSQEDQDALASILAQANERLQETDVALRRAEMAARAVGRLTDRDAVQLVRDARALLTEAGLRRIGEELTPQGAARLFAVMDRLRMPGHSSLEAEQRAGRR